MKLFISWSGDRSKLLAEALRQWLPGVINAVEPWMSSSDIDPGARWGPELASQLEETKYGIICVTAENVNAPWLLFEAGALSKYVKDSRVVPLLLDIKPTDIKGPLAQFQGIQVREKEINKLVININKAVFEAGEKGADHSIVDNSFKKWWPDLKQFVDDIPTSIAAVRKNERSEREIIEEILTLVRNLRPRTTYRPLDETTITLGKNDAVSLLQFLESIPKHKKEVFAKALPPIIVENEDGPFNEKTMRFLESMASLESEEDSREE